MKIAYHGNALCIRGTSVAMYDYAHYNEVLYNHQSVILYDMTNPFNREKGFQHFAKRFQVIGYTDFSQVDKILKDEKIDFYYSIKSGEYDHKVPKYCPVGVHVVFCHNDPHGTKYVYIAEWLSQKMSGGKLPFVPHIFQLPPPNKDFRKEMGIPSDAIVFGRHGCEEDFNVGYAVEAVKQISKERDDIYFVFLNTNKFCEDRKNIIHLPANTDLQYKSNWISACNAMIHARQYGEIFSMSIGEFLFHDKPIITWSGGKDLGHVHMLDSKGIYYSSYDECYKQLNEFHPKKYPVGYFKSIADPYSPENVMKKWNDVFLG